MDIADEKFVPWWFAVGSDSIPSGDGRGNCESALELKNEDPTEDIGEKSFSYY